MGNKELVNVLINVQTQIMNAMFQDNPKLKNKQLEEALRTVNSLIIEVK